MAEPAFGVCGFGRCGSTMVMSMLHAGGVPIAGDLDWPYELSEPREAWSLPLAGRAVKLLDVLNVFEAVPPAPAWRFVWLDRDPVEQAKSLLKFIRGVGVEPQEPDDEAIRRLVAGYRRDRPKSLAALHGAGRVLVLRYEDILADPWNAAIKLARLWPDSIDVRAMARVVHHRDGTCRPDLSVELGEYVDIAGGDR